jgi:hypothetical protein
MLRRRDRWLGAVLTCALGAAGLASCSSDQHTELPRKSLSHLNPSPTIPNFLLYAERSIALGTSDLVLDGDVGVHRPSASGSSAQVAIGAGTVVDEEDNILSPSVSLGLLSAVGDIQTNFLQNNGGLTGTVASFPAAAMPPLPLALASTPSSTNVTVGALQIAALNPGRYGALSVIGTLFLNPGMYSFASVSLSNTGHLWANPGGVKVAVRDTLTAGLLSTLLPVLGQTASDLTISVSGHDDSTTGSPAFSLGAGSQIAGLVTVPHGTLALGDNVSAVGAFAGFDVTAGHNVTLTFQNGFPPASQQPHGQQQLRGYVTPAMASAPLVGSVPASTPVHLAIGLPLRNQQQLQTFLQKVSDPTSSQFHQYINAAAFAANYGATAQDYQALTAFGNSNGLSVTGTYSNNLLLDVSGPASAIEQAFYLNLNYYLRPDGTQFFALDRDPSLDLPTPVLRVSGLDSAYVPRGFLDGSGPSNTLTAADLRNAYVPCAGSQLTGAGQTIGLFAGTEFNPNDITSYQTQNSIPVTSPQVTRIDGAPKNGGSQVEVTLDIEMANALAPGAQVVVFEGPNDRSTGTVADVLHTMANLGGFLGINQFSNSTGFNSDDNTRQAMYQFAAQGQSFFQAAADSGAYVGGVTPAEEFQPLITAVGGTILSMNGVDGNPCTPANGPCSYASEMAWNGGGGGILNLGATLVLPFPYNAGGFPFPSVPIPSYQLGFANAQNQASTMFRNVPDVSAVAVNPETVIGGITGGSGKGGTSVSAPLWAAFTALVNQRGANNGAGPVGFFNPTLYFIASTGLYNLAFHDVTSGNNDNGRNTGIYPAVPGYDLATGLGTPSCGLLYGTVGGSSPPTIPGSSMGIDIGATQTQGGPLVCVSGTGFPPGARLTTEYFGIPAHSGPVAGNSGSANADGTMTLGNDTNAETLVATCSSTQLAEVVTVMVTAKDSSGNVIGKASAAIPGPFWCANSPGHLLNGGCTCPGGGGCGCPSGQAACGGICCAAGLSCAQEVPDPLCCSSGQSACGTSCCPSADCRAGSGGTSVCCATPLCPGDNSCCTGGTCDNAGACCFGSLDSAGNCCAGGITANVCQGQCCLGNCTTNGACCSSGEVCGSACCAGNQVCLNASTSTCGVPTQPTLVLLDPALGSVIGWSGGPRVRVASGQTLRVTGRTFSAALGTITLAVDSTSGAQLTTTSADSTGNFDVRTTTGPFPAGDHALVAWQNVNGTPTVEASLLLHVELLH